MSLPGYKLLTVSKYEICVCVYLLQHTWHMSLKRKFKTEHALLVDAEVLSQSRQSRPSSVSK